MRTAKDLTRDELEAIVETAQRAFWMNYTSWDSDTQWSWERVEDIAGVMAGLGMRPDAPPCDACGGKRWRVSQRDDGRYAVERCDMCQDKSFSDEDAAKLAQAAGIECDSTYPCIVHDQTQYRSGAE